ncbi:MAG: Hsp20/alpha crystallin family protein [Treponema sp.]|jgi:HSP20 family protein|nr:Hsp20/alpha crystallin family protein [Treponema sp.]
MKAVTLYRPLTIEKALEDFDRYMDSFFGESPLTPAYKANFLPAVDIRENEGSYELEAELPGFDEKNIQVHVDGGVLTIESRQEEESDRNVSPKKDKNGESKYLIRERRNASFSRAFKLPENADANAINAVFKNGILILDIKKSPEARKKVIEIGVNRG